MKRALVYNPYWDTRGGGEKYLASVANQLQQMGWQVTVPWHEPELVKRLQERYGQKFDWAKIDTQAAELIRHGTILKKLGYFSQFELIFWLSDGSLPFLTAKVNLLHFQVPFTQVKGRSWLNQLKLKRISKVICNSQFTKRVIDQEFKVKSQVLYPPVTQHPPLKKTKTILTVGRFDNLLHHKRQDVMIQAFKQLNWPDWRLIVAGGGLKKPTEIYNAMGEIDQKQVQFVYNPSFPELSRLYGQASIYWHAAGFGEDLAVHPEKAEHFGMTTVEAMSAGAVPLVYAGGGQKEIIMDGVNGRWWQTPAKLIKLTRLIGANHDLWQALSEKARIRAKTFSEEVFADGFVQLVR